MHWTDVLEGHDNIGDDFKTWAKTFNTLEEMWAACPNATWMINYLLRIVTRPYLNKHYTTQMDAMMKDFGKFNQRMKQEDPDYSGGKFSAELLKDVADFIRESFPTPPTKPQS